MCQPIIRDRYKSYRIALMGKQLADQYTKIFNNENDSEHKYANAFIEQDKFWVANITSIKLRDNRDYYSQSVMCSNDYRIMGGLSYSLYMHKFKDFVVLKVPIFAITGDKDVDNNIRWYFGKILHKLGYNKYEFNIKRTGVLLGVGLGSYQYSGSSVKILISPNKTEDDLIKILGIVEQLNNYILSNYSSISQWHERSKIIQANIINM